MSSTEDTEISKKKPFYGLSAGLRAYLQYYGRSTSLPVMYEDLLHFREKLPVYDKHGNDTLWETAIYSQGDMEELHTGLKQIYAILKAEDGSTEHMQHLHIERIDYCTFGNSHPFRIRIVNNFNDNYDYFYIKKADASRVYGLELEHILSPERIHYFCDRSTLVEEHIAGIPGDQFIRSYLPNPEFNKVRIAKEFVKFNERCFVRLLGDMRSYNYVFDITPDFEEVQFRIRAIDFDQQCYEGRRNVYQPRFFKENNPLVKLVGELLSDGNIEQYRKEERALILRRSRAARVQLNALLEQMEPDVLSTAAKLEQLRTELAAHYNDTAFMQCSSMGALVRHSIGHLQER